MTVTAIGARRRLAILGLSLTALAVGRPALAQDSAWTLAATYTADVAGSVSGGASQAGKVLDNLMIEADLDLDKALGWKGATAHLSLLNNAGGAPNDIARTLQGVDNIEVTRPRGKIYEAWLQQDFGAASVRAGLYDLNSEFYATDAAGLLISPAFGIGSELAATGPNGPSIFPSTALAVRVRLAPSDTTYIQAAALNAHAGVIGDPGGVDTEFDHGALLAAEAGWTGRGKLALGVWRYTQDQDDILDIDAAGDPVPRAAAGAYLLLEQPLRGAEGDLRAVAGFLRLGVSDGDTTPFKDGGQAGLLMTQVFANRPDSALSVGVAYGGLSDKFQQTLAGGGGRAAASESTLELTYADRVAPRLMLQPSVQYVVHPGGTRDADPVVVLALRVSIDL
ncbi:MAG: carbohydrate porin [Phenylobacterium sp.]|uniref:carbohydrate porin n=1 Tax=Phenylobacterium sp. TaxID=1871053 RepID=UPI003BB4B243